jgi:RNA polymerase sigma-70 factor, ECF subfamily
VVDRDVRRTVEAVWRIESAAIIAGLTRMLGDLGLAEEFAQDALVAALEQWPDEGVPANPAAWLTVVAKRRAVDRVRRIERLERKHDEIGRELGMQHAGPEEEIEAALQDDVGDDLLRLIFMACHPVLSREAQVALTLRTLGGLTTEEIARGFLVSESTIAQRIVRAKRTLAQRKVPFELPAQADRASRLSAVLEVIYLIFNEGYAASSGDDWLRPALCQEALRLGRIVAELAPDEAEVHGLVALMEIQASRLATRTGPSGEPVALPDQNRALWDQLLIRRGFAALLRAQRLGGTRGPYLLQAAIAAVTPEHAQQTTPTGRRSRSSTTLSRGCCPRRW